MAVRAVVVIVEIISQVKPLFGGQTVVVVHVGLSDALQFRNNYLTLLHKNGGSASVQISTIWARFHHWGSVADWQLRVINPRSASFPT